MNKLISQFEGYVYQMIQCRVPNMYIDNCAVQNVLAVARNCQVSVKCANIRE